MNSALESGLTVDAFIGGRVEAVQRDDGSHRSGLEAVLLAAAVEDGFTGTVVDLGAGVGVAGMCVAARSPGTSVVLVDRDETALALARAALSRPANRAFASRVSVIAADVTSAEADRVAAGMVRASADLVIVNPPFHDGERGTHSPVTARAEAHMLDGVGLEPWMRAAASVLKADGRLIAIFRADGLGVLLDALNGRFGSIAILPVHPRPDGRAHRVLVRAVKEAAGDFPSCPALPFTAPRVVPISRKAEAILRAGRALAEVHPVWAG